MKEKSEEKPRFLIYRDPLREDMTECEASIILDRMKDESLTKEAFEALELAIDALEKQTPKKPIRKKCVFSESWYHLFCPSCENYVGVWSDMLKKGDMYNHSNRCICPYCGQAIDVEDIR
jgi:hypothetical protein